MAGHRPAADTASRRHNVSPTLRLMGSKHATAGTADAIAHQQAHGADRGRVPGAVRAGAGDRARAVDPRGVVLDGTVVCRQPAIRFGSRRRGALDRSEEHTSELQSLMRISYAVFCLKKKNKNTTHPNIKYTMSSKCQSSTRHQNIT